MKASFYLRICHFNTTCMLCVLILSFVLASCASRVDKGLQLPNAMGGQTQTFQNALWDDGLAEVSFYKVSESRYGILRDGKAVIIAVKEPFDLSKRVKSDSSASLRKDVEVIKLNLIKDIPTGVYTYRQMASVFFDRSTFKPLKIATSSQEWCGLTSKNIKIVGSNANFETFSYFGDEADQKFQLPIDAKTVFEDAIPLWVRSLDFSKSNVFEITQVDLQLSSHARIPPQKQKMKIKIDPTVRSIDVPAGNFKVFSVTVENPENPKSVKDVFYLESSFPHKMILWERKDGGQYALESVTRIPYWKMNRPGDFIKLKQ